MRSRVQDLYSNEIKLALKDELKLENVMEAPRISKIVLNIGVKDAIGDSKAVAGVKKVLSNIACQAAIETKAKKSIAGFKLREGMAIGVCVTLRGDNMYHFLDKLVNVVFPAVRDFQGVSKKLDGHGNYNIGIKDWMVFPEVDYDKVDKSRGMNITIETTAKTNEHGYALLEKLNMPFKKRKN